MTSTKRVILKIEKAAGVTDGTLGVLGKASQWIALLLIAALPSVSNAIQPDAEYLVREKQFGEQWAAEDKQVHEKLAALEKKFGKKPNIVFILADDIGYTELGSYGGGKVRGFSTPNLDQHGRRGNELAILLLRAVLHPHARGFDDRTSPGPHWPARRLVSGRVRDGACGRRGDRGRTPFGGGLSHGHVRQVAPGRRPGHDTDRAGLRRGGVERGESALVGLSIATSNAPTMPATSIWALLSGHRGLKDFPTTPAAS